MSKTMLAGALVASVLLVQPLAASADSGHEHKADSASEGGHSGAHGDHAASTPESESLAGAWAALTAARDAIAGDVEKGALVEVHAKAEPLPALVAALLEQSADLDAEKRARVEGAAKQLARVADALHEAADRGDAARTRKELSRLDGLLELIRAQYPAGALESGIHGHGSHSAAPEQSHGAHAHAERPAGVVEAAPQATLRIRAFDPFRFEPARLELQAGVPTRIELENEGGAEHSLVVRTPDGRADWVHLHALPGATVAGTYRLDEPGTYPVLCTVPGHTEAGMVAELVVAAHSGAQPSTHTLH
jgi:uncharacterized cupredoxin-like copper-binding protein